VSINCHQNKFLGALCFSLGHIIVDNISELLPKPFNEIYQLVTNNSIDQRQYDLLPKKHLITLEAT
jgi:predicted HTH domain antitoxin